MGIITHHHDSAGWDMVLFVALAMASVMIIQWLRQDLHATGRRCRDVVWHPSHRLMGGTSMIFAGGVLRIAATIPLRPMQAAGVWDWWLWWLSHAEWLFAAGSLLVVGGLVVLMWPALYLRFGGASLLVVGVAVAAVYAIGVGATEVAQWWF